MKPRTIYIVRPFNESIINVARLSIKNVYMWCKNQRTINNTHKIQIRYTKNHTYHSQRTVQYSWQIMYKNEFCVNWKHDWNQMHRYWHGISVGSLVGTVVSIRVGITVGIIAGIIVGVQLGILVGTMVVYSLASQ